MDARAARLANLRRRVKALKDAGWYDERDVAMIGEWVKTVTLFEIEAIVGWAERDLDECRQAKASS
jgi:hypothetical protein